MNKAAISTVLPIKPRAAAVLRVAVGIVLLVSAACQIPDHHLIYPRQLPDDIWTWSDDIDRGLLRIHLEWAKPDGCGPFPAVLVHPEGGKTAVEMKGVIWDLARRGYVAVAADYKRYIDGAYRRNTFAWRSDADVVAAFELVAGQDFVDPERIATLGFSQGGIYSLLIAAHVGRRVRAVVAYYPVTDFNYWFDKQRPNAIRRFVYRRIRGHFRRESGADTDEGFRRMLEQASPLPQAAAITAPVLLIHGDSDMAASMEESERLAARLRALDRHVELMIVPGAVHIFNFRQPELAERAWTRTLQWLRHYLWDGTDQAGAREIASPPAMSRGTKGRGMSMP